MIIYASLIDGRELLWLVWNNIDLSVWAEQGSGEEHVFSPAFPGDYIAPKKKCWLEYYRLQMWSRPFFTGYLQGDFPGQGWWGTPFPIPA